MELIYFTKNERRGVLILVLILFFLFGLQYLWPVLHKSETYDHGPFAAKIDSFLATERLKIEASVNNRMEVRREVNHMTKEELISLGLSPSVAERWMNFKHALDGFRSIEEIYSIYQMDSGWVKSNASMLVFPVKEKSKLAEVHPVSYPLFHFDPNTVDSIELQKLGFKKNSIQAIIKFRKKGGTFHEPSDLKYIYGITDAQYEKLEPFIKIKPILSKEQVATFPEKKEFTDPETITIDINQANIWEWQKLKGIGPYYAGRITAFRNKLGGFSTIEQIAETYGLPDSVFQRMRPSLVVSSIPNKLDINQFPVDSIKAHPYINWKQAQIIVNYRNQHGPYNTTEDLYRIRAFDTVFIEKIGPYLEFRK